MPDLVSKRSHLVVQRRPRPELLLIGTYRADELRRLLIPQNRLSPRILRQMTNQHIEFTERKLAAVQVLEPDLIPGPQIGLYRFRVGFEERREARDFPKFCPAFSCQLSMKAVTSSRVGSRSRHALKSSADSVI